MSVHLLGDVIDAYLGKFKPTSYKTKRRDLLPLRDYIGAKRPVDEIDGFDLLRYAGSQINCDTCNDGKPYANNTRRTKLKTIRIFFNWCYQMKLVKDNPAVMLEVPPEAVSETRDKAFSDEERRLLIDYAEGRTKHSGRRLRDLALFLFCNDTGVRRGSLALMRRRDVDLVARTARCLNTKLRTGSRPYTVHFTEYTARVLGEWFDELPDSQDCYLWSTRPPGAKMSNDSISQITGRACDALGIARRSVHGWRHALGHRMSDAGASPNLVARVLNNSEDVARRYYTPRDDETAWRRALALGFDDPDSEAGDDKIIPFNQRKKSG